MSKSQEVTESCVRRLLGSCQHMATDSASSPGANPSPQEQESNVMAVCKLYCQMAQHTHQHAPNQTIIAHWTIV